MAKKKKADPDEVAAFFSAVMRGEVETEKDQLKAAELLGKHFGMFKAKEETKTPEQISFIGDENLEN